jgi:hypothetical protein
VWSFCFKYKMLTIPYEMWLWRVDAVHIVFTKTLALLGSGTRVIALALLSSGRCETTGSLTVALARGNQTRRQDARRERASSSGRRRHAGDISRDNKWRRATSQRQPVRFQRPACTNSVHVQGCPLLMALHDVTINSVMVLTASCC